jgi:hypothetical protein
LLLTGLCLGCNNKDNTRKAPSMARTYSYKDKGPMGTSIAYRLLPQQFKGDIELASKKLKEFNPLSYLTKTTYIIINKKVLLTDEERATILQYAGRGNELFISADIIDYQLLDTLGAALTSESIETIEDEQYLMGDIKKDTYISMKETTAAEKKLYGFFYYPFDKIFTEYDTATTRVLGVNEKAHANYIVIRYGKGKIFFHTEPAAFSNYFLLTKDNTKYFEQVFSYLQPNPPVGDDTDNGIQTGSKKDSRTLYWGDKAEFGDRSKDDFSALSIFWKNPPLLWALMIGCLLMLLYIAFGSKRKRRLVPVIPPNTNATVSFVHTISNLYLQKKENRNIALKMITYFFEHVRTHYYLGTNTINQEFIQALSRKSGIAEKRVSQLVDKIEEINIAETVTDTQLFDLKNRIQEFYKR